jgi:hypothetical protein
VSWPRRRPAGSADGGHRFGCDASANAVCGVYNIPGIPGATYQFPNLRSGPGITPVTVIDNDSAGVVVRETGTDTVLVKCGDAACTVPAGPPYEDYYLRLTKRPLDPQYPTYLDTNNNPVVVTVEIAVLTDGLADVDRQRSRRGLRQHDRAGESSAGTSRRGCSWAT